MTTFTTQDRIHAEKDGSFTIDCRKIPLTDENILIIADLVNARIQNNIGNDFLLISFARAIEKTHGIA